MATISLDNMVMYQYPKPKNPSRLSAIPHGTSSFPSQLPLSGTRPSPSPPVASPVQPIVPIPLGEENRFFIPDIDVTTTQIHSQSGGFHQPTGVASVDSDTNKEHDMCNVTIDQDEYQNTERRYCNNYVDERNDTAEFANAQEISTSGVSAPVRSLETDNFSDCSDEVVHGGTIPESPMWEIPPEVANELAAPIEPSDLNVVDEESTSATATIPISGACLSNSTIIALEDKNSQPIVHQTSPTEIIATNFVAPQPERTDVSQTSGFKRKDKLQQRHCTAAGTTSKSFSVVIPHRNLRSRNTPRTRQRSRHSPSTESTETDDSNDSDYREPNHAVVQMTKKAVQKSRPAKRRKRAATSTESLFSRQEKPQGRAYSTASLQSQSSPESSTESDAQKSTVPEKIRIDGCLLRKVSLGRVEYCCWFTEDHGSTAFSPSLSDCLASFQKQSNKQDQLTNMTDLQAIKIEGFFTRDINPCGDIWCCSFKEKHVPQSGELIHQEQPTTGEDGFVEESEVFLMPISAKGGQYSPEEDTLIVQLREVEKLPWSRIAERLPGRTKGTLQVRYCTALKNKQRESHPRCRKRSIGQSKIAAEKPQALVRSPSSSRRYSLRQSRHLPTATLRSRSQEEGSSTA